MKEFKKLQEICIEEVLLAGITPGNITKWEINRRAKRRWGQCKKFPDGHCVIQIAAQLLEDDRVSERACKETIIHEILHSCPECNGHTGNWKAYADKMNKRYGYNIKRTTSGEEKGVENYKSERRAVKYVFMCRYCKNLVTRTRKSKFTHYYRNYGCGVCGMPRAFDKY